MSEAMPITILAMPKPEILLFGTEEGTAETARELGLVHVAEAARNRGVQRERRAFLGR
jgi:hypothetical protein